MLFQIHVNIFIEFHISIGFRYEYFQEKFFHECEMYTYIQMHTRLFNSFLFPSDLSTRICSKIIDT